MAGAGPVRQGLPVQWVCAQACVHICLHLSVVHAEIQQSTDTVNLCDKTKGTNLALVNATSVPASRKIHISEDP